MPYDNEFYLASAGAGKTTMVSDYAVNNPTKKILLTTYTHENTTLLQKTISAINGVQPQNVTIMSWFSFLLAECVRPYQNFLYSDERIENLHFVPFISAKFKRRDDIRPFYLSDKTHIYSDKMSDFAYRCNVQSGGLVVQRLEQLIDVFILDEAQDISGWDLDFIGLLLKSKIKVIMVGDVRQRTYSTSQSMKNKKFSDDIYSWFTHLQAKGYGEVKLLNRSYRCIQSICDFSDSLFPTLPQTTSLNKGEHSHIGLYTLDPADLHRYCELYTPQILGYNIAAAKKAMGLPMRNFGVVKGQTYNHVVIIPTGPIEKFLGCGDIAKIEATKEKLYVAITRARFSVAFLRARPASIQSILKWSSP